MEELLKQLSNMSKGKQSKKEEGTDRPAQSVCKCGYNPQDSTRDEKDTCNVKLALQNHISFPSFAFLSDYNDPSTLYYDFDNSPIYPARHWAALIEIEEAFYFGRYRLTGWNQFGEQIAVHFYQDNNEQPKTFDWESLKAGNTLVILYANKKTFLDLSEGIRQEDLDVCYVFNAPISVLQEEAQKLLDYADKKSSVCFHCGKLSEELKQCGSCRLAKYCSRECQTDEWKKSHKKLCSQSEVLLRLASLPRYPFRDYVSFVKPLLPYKAPKMSQNARKHKH